MSIRLGQKNERAAAQMVANCFALLTGMALIIMIVSYLFKDQLLVFFGAGPAIFPYANQYMSWYLTGTAFALISAGMNQFIICQGFATVGMKSVVLGAVSNIVLDPVFIFVMNMGVRGAAIATVLSQMASCIYVLLFLFGADYLWRLQVEDHETGAFGGLVPLFNHCLGQPAHYCYEHGYKQLWRT